MHRPVTLLHETGARALCRRACVRHVIRSLPVLLACGLVLLTGCSSDSSSSRASDSTSSRVGESTSSDVAPRGGESSSCDRYASPHGPRRATGSRTRPFPSLERLLCSLRPRQGGCLMGGPYPHSGG